MGTILDETSITHGGFRRAMCPPQCGWAFIQPTEDLNRTKGQKKAEFGLSCLIFCVGMWPAATPGSQVFGPGLTCTPSFPGLEFIVGRWWDFSASIIE